MFRQWLRAVRFPAAHQFHEHRLHRVFRIRRVFQQHEAYPIDPLDMAMVYLCQLLVGHKQRLLHSFSLLTYNTIEAGQMFESVLKIWGKAI